MINLQSFKKDIMFDFENNDILIVNGDVVFGDASGQNIQFLLTNGLGEFKLFPSRSIDIEQYVNSPSYIKLNQIVKNELIADGYRVDSLEIKNIDGKPTFDIKAEKIK